MNENGNKEVKNGVGIFLKIISSISVSGLVLVGMAFMQFITKERYKTGPKAGSLKWVYSLRSAVDNFADVATGAAGMPYSGPKGDFYYPFSSANRANDEENKSSGLPERPEKPAKPAKPTR